MILLIMLTDITKRIQIVFFSIITIFISGIMANLENNLKEIIVLSILSQLGLIMIILSFEFRLIAYYHLLVDAIFKSMLFITAGTVIHSMKNTQYIRLLGNLNEVILYVIIRLLISSIALRNVSFRNKYIVNMFILIIISLLLSYSVQLFYYLFFNRRLKFYRYINIKEDILINVPIIII
ncbi:NU5M oxidoreductase, partial [Acromyrmex heyeri]